MKPTFPQLPDNSGQLHLCNLREENICTTSSQSGVIPAKLLISCGGRPRRNFRVWVLLRNRQTGKQQQRECSERDYGSHSSPPLFVLRCNCACLNESVRIHARPFQRPQQTQPNLRKGMSSDIVTELMLARNNRIQSTLRHHLRHEIFICFFLYSNFIRFTSAWNRGSERSGSFIGLIFSSAIQPECSW